MNDSKLPTVARWTAVLAAALVAGAALADVAAPLSKADFQAAKRQIEQQFKTRKQACAGLDGNAEDLCLAEAKGWLLVAKAELEADYEPSPETERDAKQARAKATYALARGRCDEAPRTAREACLKRAKASFESAMRISKVERVRATKALQAKEREQEEAREKAARPAPAARAPARAGQDAKPA